jgi:hypothetical protein
MRVRKLVVSSCLLTLFLILTTSSIVASSGLKVIVHVTGSGKVCVFSIVENLGCRYVEGTNEVPFQFSPDVVKVMKNLMCAGMITAKLG